MKNILYINPIGEEIIFGIIWQKTQIQKINIPFFVFSEVFPETLIKTINTYNIDEIWLVAGPATFTKIRIITLTINTLKYTHTRILFKQIHFFEIIPKEHIPILEVNNREYMSVANFDKEWRTSTKNGELRQIFIEKKDIIDSDFCWYLKEKIGNFNFTSYVEDFDIISNIFNQKSATSRVYPIYLKNPHITC